MKIFIFLIILVSCNLNAEALSHKIYRPIIVSEVTSVYDGDTFRANLKGYPEIIGARIAIRVKGIDAPEKRAQCSQEKALALQAQAFTAHFLQEAKVITLREPKRGKYFHIVAEVYADDQNLGEALIKQGLAVPYEGSTKTWDWCGEN